MRFNKRDKGRCPRCWSTKIRDDRKESRNLRPKYFALKHFDFTEEDWERGNKRFG